MREGISRSRQNRIFGGVASGLANYLSIDPIIVRILFVVSVFFSGIGILLYLIMWIFIHEEKFTDFTYTDMNSEKKSDDTFQGNINFTIPKKDNKNGQVVFGIILVLIGLFFLGIEVFSFLNFEDLFPILLVGFGIYFVWNSKNKRG